MIWFKKLALTRIFTWIVTLIVTGSLLFPLFPVSQNYRFTAWIMPTAQADVVSAFKGLLERTGLYSPPRSGTAPLGRRVGGAGRGPICALLKDVQGTGYQKPKPFNKNIMALMPLQVTDESTATSESTASEPGNPLQPGLPGATLIPPPRTDTGFVGGLTTEARPTFWFYVPYVATPETSPNRVAQFVLLDETERPVWNELMSVKLLENPRLVEYPLAYTLETNKLYSWYFSVICDSEKLSRNPVVRGWVQRVEPTEELKLALRNAPRFEQYMAYAENGIWFETVNSLVKIRRQFPSVNRDAWTGLLSYFKVPDNRLYLESAEPTARELISGNQLPARMYGDQ
jgi:Domain of Unknown Function (DUF928)